jgi:hypothetical protein
MVIVQASEMSADEVMAATERLNQLKAKAKKWAQKRKTAETTAPASEVVATSAA